MDKRALYQLIISQLHEDGFTDIATQLSNVTLIPRPPQVEPQRLFKLARQGRNAELGAQKEKGAWESGVDEDGGSHSSVLFGSSFRPKLLDMERERQEGAPEKLSCRFSTRYLTTHKGSVRCARFSYDGKLVATGSVDSSVKLADVDKMRSAKDSDGSDEATKNVTRSFYDHTTTVTDVCFHPNAPLLVSCSKDMSIKFYDYSKSHAKRSFRAVQDSTRLRSVDFHPSGDFLAAAGKDTRIRVFDSHTLQAFTGQSPKDNHQAAINMVRYSLDGAMFASASKDGTIKIWDATNASIISTFTAAHSGYSATSVQFSRNGRYLLSCGKDSTVKLWDLATSRPLRIYSGAVLAKRRLPAIFNYSEDYVIAPDESGAIGIIWDTRTGDQLQKLVGHNQLVRYIAASPVENAIMTCSDDSRARFWIA